LSPWSQRILDDAQRDSFSVAAYRPNYLLFATHMSSPNQAPYQALGQGDVLTHNEIEFQISLRAKFGKHLFGAAGGDLWLGYTQNSWWQAYNRQYSSPFRETDYQPDGWLSFLTDVRLLGFSMRQVSGGFVHQSNGQSGSLSRSWNRVAASADFVRGDWRINLKPWVRVPESQASDNNPDIERYLGHMETRILYRTNGDQLLSVMVRNVFDREHRLNAELAWTFPIAGKLRGMVQYYYGYGESLIDYNFRMNRIGIGIAFTDWI
jgi:phospholipase A1